MAILCKKGELKAAFQRQKKEPVPFLRETGGKKGHISGAKILSRVCISRFRRGQLRHSSRVTS